MAFYTSRRSWSRYGRRGYRRSRYNVRSRAWGNQRAATQQRDSTNVVINRIVPLSIIFPERQRIGGASLNIWLELTKSDFYTNYAQMYDQVKLNGVRAKINGSIQGTNTNSYLTPTITTAWDRNGLSATTPSSEDISTYSSAISKPWSLGNAFSQTRSIYPQTMQEKSEYIATQTMTTAANVQASPTSPTQWNALTWKPQLLLQVALPTGAGLGGQTMSFNIELDISIKLRGLRKGAATSGNVDLPNPNANLVVTYIGTDTQPTTPLSNFARATNNINITIPANNSCWVIINHDNRWETTLTRNTTTSNMTKLIESQQYYFVGTNTANSFWTSDNIQIINFYDYGDDNKSNFATFYKNGPIQLQLD
uniref:Cap n=1 Tax=CRESS DNA virus TaxID=3138951 RepID=A0AAU8H5X3_9VIRU